MINFIKSSGIGDVRWSSEVLDYVNQLLFENAEDGKKAIQNILNAYNEAVKEKYRFFSFGDAMFIK